MKNNKKYQYMRTLMWVGLVFLLLVKGFKVQASEINEMYESVVEINLFYVSEDENRYLIKRSCGIGISNEEGEVTYIITNLSNVNATEEELTYLFEANSISDEKEKYEIDIILDKNLSLTADIYSGSDALDLAILQLKQRIYNRPIVYFDMDEDVEEGDIVYSIGNLSKGITKGKCFGVLAKNRNEYLAHDISLSEDNIGGALFNDKNELIGINQKVENENNNYSLSTRDIGYVLDNLGISYLKADHTVVIIETDKLEAIINVVEKMDLTNYTKESIETLQNTILASKEVLNKTEVTQEEIDSAYEELTKAQENLVIDESISTTTIIIIIVIAVLVISIISLILVIVLGKKKRLRIEKEREELEGKKAKIISTPYKATNNLFDTKNQYVSSNTNNNKSSKTVKPVRTEIYKAKDKEPEEYLGTTLLGIEDEPKKSIELINEQTNEKILLDSKNYKIGKSKEDNQIVLQSKAVSRRHCVILWMNGYYIKDLGSTNGTFVNKNKLESNKEYPLKPGDEIKVADVIFKIKAS